MAWRRLSPITSNYLFSRIIASKSKKNKDHINQWLHDGGEPRFTPNNDYESIFEQAKSVSTPLTRHFCALLGILSSVGHFQFSDTYVYRCSIPNGSVISSEALLPLTLHTKGKICCDKSYHFFSVDPFFIDWLESHGFLTWNNRSGRFFIPLDFIESLEEQNKNILISNAFCRHVRIQSSNYIVASIHLKNKNWEHIHSIMQMFINVKLSPSVLLYEADQEEAYDEKLSKFCDDNNIEYHLIRDHDTDQILFQYGPLGNKLIPDYNFDKNSETLKRIVEDTLPNGYLSADFTNNLIGLVEYYNEVYSQVHKLPHSEGFREAIENQGGLDANKFERMLKHRKQTKILTYCQPIWILLDSGIIALKKRTEKGIFITNN